MFKEQRSYMRGIHLVTACAATLFLAHGCAREKAPAVVVYTALDEMYSQPILAAFTEQTGIRVLPVYDTEASKTTGMVSRLIAERDRPRADVFWNNETAQTIILKNKGILEAYHSPSAESIPDTFKDPEGFWTGFAARGRVIIYNTDLVKEPPSSIRDLLKPEWAGRAAIANPLFGTTATHAAALFAAWGDNEAKAFFQGLKDNQIAILAGNATVRDHVASGEYAWGLTDTDDANGAVEDGRPAKWVYPDQGPDGLGTLVIPNTVALVKGAPHPDAAQKLIDYLLSPQVEEALSKMRSIQIPLNPNVVASERVPKVSDTRTMAITFDEIAARMESTAVFVKEEFLQ